MTEKIDLYDDKIGFVELVDSLGDDTTVVNAARVSFGKRKTACDDADRKLVRFLVRHKHTSTLEHNILTLRIKVPLFVARQHMRHRTFAFNEISARYSEVADEFYLPKSFRTQHTKDKQASNERDLINPVMEEYTPFSNSPENTSYQCWTASDLMREHCDDSLELYKKLLEKGICREQARMVLPVCMYTEYIATASMRNWLHFIGLRVHKSAQWEIQRVAEVALGIMRALWPTPVEAWIEENCPSLLNPPISNGQEENK